MNLVRFNKEHYHTLCEWWAKYGHANISFSSLSPIGLICYKEETPLCMSFLYLAAGSDLGWICWTTGNPDASKDDRKDAIEYCLQGLFELSKSYGREHVVCYSQSKSITKVFTNAGFAVGLPHDMLYGQVGG